MANPDYAARQASVAQDAVELINRKLDLEETKDSGTQLYHVLHALIEWCEVYGADFDATLSEVRRDYEYAREATDAQRAPDSPAGPLRSVLFVGQAWIADNAMEVDDGRASYDITEAEYLEGGGDDAEDYDYLAQAALAPQWVKDWAGPFEVYPSDPEEESDLQKPWAQVTGEDLQEALDRQAADRDESFGGKGGVS
jgi:hypothetical protein